jgi:amidase
MSANDNGAFAPGPSCRVAPTTSGPLDGLRFTAKDLFDVAGYVTGGGNPDWRQSHAPATETAAAVAKLLLAGAELIGRTVSDELAFSLEGENVHDGTPVNPVCPDRLPGGSSSGSAVAVASCLCDFALGTDTGGSVRIPASFCGLHGFRPTHGRIPLTGVIPFAPSYDTVGWFARDGRTLAAVGEIMLGGAGARAAGPTRFLVARDAFALAAPRCAEELLREAARFHPNESIDVFRGEQADFLEAYRVLQGAEIWQSLGPWIESAKPRFGPAIAARFADAATITTAQVASYLPVRRRIAERLHALVPPRTVLLLPTSPTIALRKDAEGDERGAFYRAALTLTSIAGHAGLPQLTLPLARSEGCPIGLSLLAARDEDLSLLGIARTAAEGRSA